MRFLPALVVLLTGSASAQRVDFVCSNPRLHPGLVLRIGVFTPEGSVSGNVVGPMVHCTDGFLVLGLYPGQDDPEYRVATASIRRVWVRNHAGPLGLLVGAAAGAASGAGIAAVRSDLCYRGAPPVASPCHHDVVSYALVGGVVGGLLGYVLGRGFPHWNRIFP